MKVTHRNVSRASIEPEEMMNLAGAAHYLKCSPRTLESWILHRRFGPADGLRRVGDLIRIHMPTLREPARDIITDTVAV